MVSDKTLVGLDIGTSWVRAAIGSVSRDGNLMIEAISERASDGVRSGSIVNIEQTLKAINSVISDAELQSGTEVSSAILGIGGDHIEGISSNGAVGITSKDQEIKNDDIRKSIEIARARDIPQDSEILHTLERGCTRLEARGMWSGEERPVLFCVLGRSETVWLKQTVAQCDPQAIVVISEVHEVFGEGFRQIKA